MADLRTDFKDDIYQGNRKYIQITNEDGTVSFLDATDYEQRGDFFGAEDVNTITTEIISAKDKADLAFQSASDGKILISGAITGKGVPTQPDDTFQKMATNINAIETDKTGDATAVAGDILASKIAYAKGVKLTGTIPSKSVATITPGTTNQVIGAGQYLSGAQTILGDADLIPANILSGKNIFGVAGNVIAGKRFASGEIAFTQTTLNFTTSADTVTSSRYVIVSGLDFLPSVIILKTKNDNRDLIVFYNNKPNAEEYSYKEIVHAIFMGTSHYASDMTFKADVNNAYVNSGGFRLPLGTNAPPGGTCYWYAFE